MLNWIIWGLATFLVCLFFNSLPKLFCLRDCFHFGISIIYFRNGFSDNNSNEFIVETGKMESSKAKGDFSALLPEVKMNLHYQCTCILKFLLHSRFSANGWDAQLPTGEMPLMLLLQLLLHGIKRRLRAITPGVKARHKFNPDPWRALSKVLSAAISLKVPAHQV